MLHAAGFDQFVDQDDFTQEMVAGGRSLVSLERNRRNREVERMRRDQGWSSKLSGVQSKSSLTSTIIDSDRIRNLRSDRDDTQPIMAAEEREDSLHSMLQNSSPLREHPPPNMFDDL